MSITGVLGVYGLSTPDKYHQNRSRAFSPKNIIMYIIPARPAVLIRYKV